LFRGSDGIQQRLGGGAVAALFFRIGGGEANPGVSQSEVGIELQGLTPVEQGESQAVVFVMQGPGLRKTRVRLGCGGYRKPLLPSIICAGRGLAHGGKQSRKYQHGGV